MSDEQIKSILEKSKIIAMIGISSEKKGEDPKNLKRKPANVVMKYMQDFGCLLYTSPSPRDRQKSRMPSSA